MGEKVELTKAKEDEWPVCPWCNQEIRELKFKERGWLTDVTVFWCPHCLAVLSISKTFNG